MSNDTDTYWGNPAFGGAFVKFDTDGDEVTGRIIALGTHTFAADDTKAESIVPKLTLRLADGTETEVTAGFVDMKFQLIKAKPAIGDDVKIARIRKVGTKILFDVKVKYNAGAPAAIVAPAATQNDEAPF